MSFRRNALLSLIMLAWMFGLGRAGDAQTLPISLAQYEQALSSVRGDCISAAAGDSSSGKAAIDALRPIALIPVHLPSGALVFADNRPIIGQMQVAESGTDTDAATNKWSDIAMELEQLRSQTPAPVLPAIAPDTATDKARDVLSTPEFASLPIAPRSVWDRMGDAIGKWIDSLLKKFHPSAGPAPPDWVARIIPEILLVIIATAAVGLIVYVITSIVRGQSFGSRIGAGADLGLAMTSEERDLVASYNYSRLRELALEAAARGEFRAAYRLTFIATLVFLNFEGAIKLDRSKTNWEYLRSLPTASEIRSELRPIVQDFDRIWYGNEDASQSDFERVSSGYEGIRRIIGASIGGLDSEAHRRLKKAVGAT